MPRLRWSVPALVAALVVSSVAEAGPRRVIPEVVDLPQAVAERALQSAGFRARAVPSTAPGVPGTVAVQSPGGFWYADTGTEVMLEVRGLATGPSAPDPTIPGPTAPGPTVPGPGPSAPAGTAPRLPTVVGRTEAEALDALPAWSVRIVYVASAPGSEGRVTAMDPAAGTPLAPNQQVTLSIGSAGAPPAGASVVPNVVGMSADAANAALKAARLVPLLNTVPADAAGAGRVVSQEPAAGIVVARDSNVVVNVGAGAPSALLEAEVPDLRRLSEVEARAKLAGAGLTVNVLDRLVGGDDANLVVDQAPPAGTRLSRGANVTVTVGRLLLLPIRVPEVLNLEADAAEQTLQDLGFAVERGTALSLPGSQGRVIGQEPGGGASVTRGSVVRIVVGATNTIQSVPVPDVTGMTEAVATQRLRADGFVVARATIPGAPNEAGVVRGTQPTARTPLARGSQVTLVVAEAPTPPRPAAPPLPNYVGMDVTTAQRDLATRQLQAAVTYVVSVPEGRVVAQNPPPGTPLASGAVVTLTVSRAPTLGAVRLLDPAPSASLPKNYGLVFRWTPVPEAEDYEFEIFKAKDDTWVVADHDIERKAEKRPSRVKTGTYQWHVRARRANGAITGPWSEFRRVTIY